MLGSQVASLTLRRLGAKSCRIPLRQANLTPAVPTPRALLVVKSFTSLRSPAPAWCSYSTKSTSSSLRHAWSNSSSSAEATPKLPFEQTPSGQLFHSLQDKYHASDFKGVIEIWKSKSTKVALTNKAYVILLKSLIKAGTKEDTLRVADTCAHYVTKRKRTADSNSASLGHLLVQVCNAYAHVGEFDKIEPIIDSAVSCGVPIYAAAFSYLFDSQNKTNPSALLEAFKRAAEKYPEILLEGEERLQARLVRHFNTPGSNQALQSFIDMLSSLDIPLGLTMSRSLLHSFARADVVGIDVAQRIIDTHKDALTESDIYDLIAGYNRRQHYAEAAALFEELHQWPADRFTRKETAFALAIWTYSHLHNIDKLKELWEESIALQLPQEGIFKSAMRAAMVDKNFAAFIMAKISAYIKSFPNSAMVLAFSLGFSYNYFDFADTILAEIRSRSYSFDDAIKLYSYASPTLFRPIPNSPEYQAITRRAFALKNANRSATKKASQPTKDLVNEMLSILEDAVAVRRQHALKSDSAIASSTAAPLLNSNTATL